MSTAELREPRKSEGASPPLTELLSAFPQPAALVGGEGRISWANAAFRGLFGPGGVPASVVEWEAGSPPGAELLWGELTRTKTAVRRLACARGIDSMRLTLLPGRSGGDGILVCISTTSGRGLRELQERTTILEAIFHSLNEGVLAIDDAERITAFSHSAERITGFAEAEVLGRVCRDVFQAPPQMECPFQTMIRQGKGFHHREMVLRGKGGRPVHVAVNATLLRDPTDSVEGAVVILRDLSDLDRLRQEIRRTDEVHGIVGNHPTIRKIIDKLETVAPSEASILILGESGTGKELVAKAIHEISARKEGPFIKVNCAALADNLLESELFGHVRGAFTGAVRDRAGRFEAADGGTLFLDEIGETSSTLQVKLLRVLQEGEYERVGESRTRRADVRIVAATNRELRREVAAGRFREDLFYRLCVVPIEMPPLRVRRDDIPLLTDHFLKRLAVREGRRKAFASEVFPLLQRYAWPGNVRELENAVAHAYVCTASDTIGPNALPEHVLSGETLFEPESPQEQDREGDRRSILDTLDATGWNKGEAAERLGVSRTTLWRRMRALGIQDRRHRL